ncbi:hypothetical protein [Moorena producens]|uniref:hypothetical protein n=1 Tax=Moorena producens TaxID=1155739 RepID=UPI003C71B954
MGGTPKTALAPQDRAASLNKNLHHLPISPSPHPPYSLLPTPYSLLPTPYSLFPFLKF